MSSLTQPGPLWRNVLDSFPDHVEPASLKRANWPTRFPLRPRTSVRPASFHRILTVQEVSKTPVRHGAPSAQVRMRIVPRQSRRLSSPDGADAESRIQPAAKMPKIPNKAKTMDFLRRAKGIISRLLSIHTFFF